MVLTLAGCAATGRSTSHAAEFGVDHAVREVLRRQVAAWNRGNIDGFMEGYWRSPDLMFVSGAEVTRGWQATLNRYRVRYAGGEAMGNLIFTDVEVRELARDAALVSGRWHIDRAEPTGGRFTLLFRLKDDRWVVVYDHTSTSDP